MEPRKIIKFGNSSYVITLPFEWIKKHGLEKGSSLNLNENDSSIVLSLQKEDKEKSAVINLDNKPLKLLNRELISYYLKNYKYIKLSGKDCINRIEELKVMKEKLSSIEIIEINNDYIVLKDLTNPSQLNVLDLINEIIDMEKILITELIKKDRPNKHYFITQLDSNINKLSFLAYKSINYNLDVLENTSHIKWAIQYHRIVSSLETIGDIIKRVARYMKDANEENINSVIPILESIEKYYCFIVSLLKTGGSNLDKNLLLYMDKKQSLLREIEFLRDNMKSDLNLYLVITQLLKDIVGQLDVITISIIDINSE